MGLKFLVFLDWGLGMENKTGGLTLLSIWSGEKLSKHSCGFPRPPIDEFGGQSPDVPIKARREKAESDGLKIDDGDKPKNQKADLSSK
jgi:hypothetical protein